MNTRGLQAGVVSRITTETVTLVYNDEYDNGDGSARVTDDLVTSPASVVALQPKDIQRLEIAGIIIKNGVTIVLPGENYARPDRILRDEYTSYRVVMWSIANGIIVATCDLIPIDGTV